MGNHKILFISSAHPVLEYDDLSLFTELGIDWFSTGIYLDPQNPDVRKKRRAINKIQDQDLIAEFLKSNSNRICDKHNNPNAKVFVTKEFVDKFDLVIADKFFYYIEDNWSALKDSNVYWRTFYYSSLADEHKAKSYRSSGLKVIRMYEQEKTMIGNCDTDYVLPNYVDGDEYNGWTGHNLQTLTFQNDFFARYHSVDQYGQPRFAGYRLYAALRQHYPQLNWIFHGYNNRADFCLGVVSWEKQKELYKNSRVYFSLGSKPGPYTYSLLEAMATGTPTISFGMGLGDCYDSERVKNSYIVPKIIENGVDGFFSDNPKDLIGFITELYRDEQLANTISANARKKVLNLYGKAVAKNKWKEFFEKEL